MLQRGNAYMGSHAGAWEPGKKLHYTRQSLKARIPRQSLGTRETLNGCRYTRELRNAEKSEVNRYYRQRDKL